ncbi:MAG: DUF697 domain-containing protein [Crocosphaera sp.]|nr:DUF697 domain-containing protein [Crocosphaera sp.]
MMTVQIKKPILVVGLGISFLLWIAESLHQEIMAIGEWGILSLMAVGTGFWLWQKQGEKKPSFKGISPLTLTEVQQSISQAEQTLDYIKKENPDCNLSQLESQLKQLPKKLNNSSLAIGLVGNSKSEKNSLQNNLREIETFKEFDVREQDLSENISSQLDIIVLLVSGDLTDSQWQIIKNCHQKHQRCLIILNKQDKYNLEDKEIILQQIKQRVNIIIPDDDVMAINSLPSQQKVRQYQADGSYQEWLETKPAKIEDLTARLEGILNQDRQQLSWGKVWREAELIKEQSKLILNKIRRNYALPVIERYQWIAAGAAFANPVSSLDLLATAAINGQMIVDLSKLYQQKLTLNQGQTISATIAKLMIKLGLVELSTHAISSVLKSNAITYVAGGATQGISAAYLTRIAGLSLVEYFQEQPLEPDNNQTLDIENLSDKIKHIFEQTRRREILQTFVKQTVPKLG